MKARLTFDNSIGLPSTIVEDLVRSCSFVDEVYYKANPDGTVTLSAKPFPMSTTEKRNYALSYLRKNSIGAVLQFIPNTRTTVAVIPHGDSAPSVGIANCAPDDYFNPPIGKAIALMRARNEPAEVINKLIY